MFAVYEIATGKLISTGTVLADPLPPGLAFKVANIYPGIWNPATLLFDPLPTLLRLISRMDFLRRLTSAERQAIKTAAKTNQSVDDFLFMFENTTDLMVNLDSQELIDGLAYFVAQGLLAANRPAEIRI